MKYKYLFLLVAACFFITLNAQVNYSNLIVASPKTSEVMASTIYDLQQELLKSTGQNFALKKDTVFSGGIEIIKLDLKKDSSYVKMLPPENADVFLLNSDGENYLKIVAYTWQGLTNGIYTYLDTLGFKWYGPGDDWAVIPVLKDVRLKCDKVYLPDFSLRNFFGTFGTPRIGEIDPKRIVDYQWALWSKRNRMTGGLQGHIWTEFMWRHIPELKINPEYMAEVNGKRVFPDSGKKFCVSNKGFQELFISDMLNLLEKQMKNAPEAGKWSVSVEPVDGEGGDCECDECKKEFGNISNADFYLANQVAKAFQKISLKTYVNLYAYNNHAAPPDFELEKNVIVQIIPYGYQNYASPEKMIAEWKKKDHDLYIYDYFGLPINNVDMPLRGGLTAENYGKRMQYWYEQNIKGATLESSYSIGATGLGLYLFTRLGWNIHADVNQLVDDYFKGCFGKAAMAVKQAYVTLSYDTAVRIANLNKAMLALRKQTKGRKLTPDQQARLTDYKAYLHYLRLLYNMQLWDKTKEPATSDTLMRYTYGIFNTMMVHPFPITEFIKHNGLASAYVTQYWDNDRPSAAGMKFKSVVALTPRQIEEAFEADCRELKK